MSERVDQRARPGDEGPVLTTARLRLRVPADGDVDAIFAIHSDVRTYQHRPDLVMKSQLEAVELVREWQGQWARDGIGYFVAQTQEGQTIGFSGVRCSTERGEEVLNLYYRFAPEAQGRGYAVEAAGAAITWAKAVRPELPIVAVIDPANGASIRLAEKLGLRLTPKVDGADETHDVYRL